MMGADHEIPIKEGSRGFVRKDGTVFGWSLYSGEHNEYHLTHGTGDRDFLTRWRVWNSKGGIDFEERPIQPEWVEAVERWVVDHGDELIPIHDAEAP